MRSIPLHKVPQDKTCQTKLIIQPNRFNRIVTLIIPSVFLQSHRRQPPKIEIKIHPLTEKPRARGSYRIFSNDSNQIQDSESECRRGNFAAPSSELYPN